MLISKFWLTIFVSFLLLTDLDAVFNGLYGSLYVKLQVETTNNNPKCEECCSIATKILPFTNSQKI